MHKKEPSVFFFAIRNVSARSTKLKKTYWTITKKKNMAIPGCNFYQNHRNFSLWDYIEGYKDFFPYKWHQDNPPVMFARYGIYLPLNHFSHSALTEIPEKITFRTSLDGVSASKLLLWSVSQGASKSCDAAILFFHIPQAVSYRLLLSGPILSDQSC